MNQIRMLNVDFITKNYVKPNVQKKLDFLPLEIGKIIPQEQIKKKKEFKSTLKDKYKTRSAGVELNLDSLKIFGLPFNDYESDMKSSDPHMKIFKETFCIVPSVNGNYGMASTMN